LPDDPTRSDLPTGPKADSNPPEPDRPDDTGSQSHAGGFTLDLSSKKKPTAPKSWRRQRKKADPLTTKIFDFTQSKAPPEPPTPEPTPDAKPTSKAKTASKNVAKKSKPKRSASGSTLADLLDPETLARLRGDG
jgi:hypothetical protein